MFEYFSEAQIKRIQPKLEALRKAGLENLVVVCDFDDTLVDPHDPANIDYAPFEPYHHYFLRKFAPSINHFIILGARCQKSALIYLGQYGEIHNLSLATNSGYLWRQNIASREATSVIIPVPGYAEYPSLFDDVQRGIKKTVLALQKEYPSVIPDICKLYSSTSYLFDTPEEAEAFCARAKEKIKDLGEPLSSRIDLVFKSKKLITPEGREKTQGFVDFKPLGLNKDYAAKTILSDFGYVTPNTFLIVAGDGPSDYLTMQGAAQVIPRDRLMCIDVGGALEARDADRLIDVVLKRDVSKTEKRQRLAIDQLYLFFEDILDCGAPSRGSVGCANKDLTANGPKI